MPQLNLRKMSNPAAKEFLESEGFEEVDFGSMHYWKHTSSNYAKRIDQIMEEFLAAQKPPIVSFEGSAPAVEFQTIFVSETELASLNRLYADGWNPLFACQFTNGVVIFTLKREI